MLKTSRKVALVILAIVAASPQQPEGAPPVVTSKCQLTFDDRSAPDDAVRSDGRGVYHHGLDGVECQIYTAAGASQDATLLLSGKTSRRFTIDYTNVALASPVAAPPTGTATDGSFMVIQNIGAMEVGETKTTTVGLETSGGNLRVRWCGDLTTGCKMTATAPPSSLVTVTRTATTQWTVTTDPPGGDEAVMYQKTRNAYQAIALYHLPLSLVISCPTCTAD